jgi:hypothetical protein
VAKTIAAKIKALPAGFLSTERKLAAYGKHYAKSLLKVQTPSDSMVQQ